MDRFTLVNADSVLGIVFGVPGGVERVGAKFVAMLGYLILDS
jgi:hypothetical protein